MDWVANDRFTRKKIDLGPFRKNEGIKLGLDRGIGNLGQAALSVGGASEKDKEGKGEK